MIDLMRLILGRRGFEVKGAAGGVEGLKMIRQEKPDLVLLDLMMPDMDGFEVIEHMREMPAAVHLPVIVVTAKELDAEEQDWLRARTRHCCQKPVTATTFLVTVRMALSETTPARR